MAASAGAIFLALAPGGVTGGEYDAELAVLTGTLVALIWYAYFTFRVARSIPSLSIATGLQFAQEHLGLMPEVMNPTDRRLDVRITLGLWIDGERVPLGEFYEGDRRVPIDPGRKFIGNYLALDDHLDLTEPDEYRVRSIQNQRCLVAMQVAWIDNLCEAGETTTLHQHTDFTTPPDAVVDPVRIERLFGDLEGYQDSFGPIEGY